MSLRNTPPSPAGGSLHPTGRHLGLASGLHSPLPSLCTLQRTLRLGELSLWPCAQDSLSTAPLG